MVLVPLPLPYSLCVFRPESNDVLQANPRTMKLLEKRRYPRREIVLEVIELPLYPFLEQPIVH